MSKQTAEVIYYQGRRYALHAEPLDEYFRLQGIDPGFEPPDSSLLRGYHGTWEIRDDRLYLIGLRAHLMDGSEADLAALCPVAANSPTGEAFAIWYSGELCIGQDDLAAPSANEPLYRQADARIIQIIHGEVIAVRHVDACPQIGGNHAEQTTEFAGR